MNLFKDYFSAYVDAFQLSSLENGQIVRFAVKKEERELLVVLALDELVEYSVFKAAENSIKNNMNLKKATIKPRYISSLFEINYFPSVVEFVKKKNSAANGFFDGADIEFNNNRLTINLKKGGKDILSAQKVDEDIESVMLDLFGIDV